MDNRTLCLLYLTGEASEEEVAALSEWIAESSENAEAFALLAAQDAHLVTAVGKHCKPQEDTPDLLLELAALEEASGPAQVVDVTNQVVAQQLLEKQQRAEAKRRLQDQSRSRQQRLIFVVPKAVVWVGLAAAVALAATLLFYVADTTTNPTPIDLAQPDEPGASTQEAVPTRAVVVRSLDALWETGGANAGHLTKGNHTLADGMVEIKLLSGTQVILEAPVSFVLTDINRMEIFNGRAVADVPRSSTGFEIQTPSARLTETAGQYSDAQSEAGIRLVGKAGVDAQLVRTNAVQTQQSTTFGVHVDGQRQTHVQVFAGEVQAASIINRRPVREPITLSDEQSAILTPNAEPVRVAFDAMAFKREITTRLSLIDMVMGGDGTTQRQNIGLHPLTGQHTRQIKGDQSLIGLNSTGRTQPVPGSQYVSAVFIPSKDGSLQGLPAGLTLPNLPETNGLGYGLMWSGREMPSVSQSSEVTVPAKLPGHNFAGAGQQAMVMHTNCGFILDLDAIRAMNPDYEVVAVQAVVGNSSDQVEQDSAADSRSEFYIYRDNELAMRSTFLRSAPDDQRVAKIDLSLLATDRYLTFVSTDGGDGNHQGWIVLGGAEILLKPLPNTDLEF